MNTEFRILKKWTFNNIVNISVRLGFSNEKRYYRLVNKKVQRFKYLIDEKGKWSSPSIDLDSTDLEIVKELDFKAERVLVTNTDVPVPVIIGFSMIKKWNFWDSEKVKHNCYNVSVNGSKRTYDFTEDESLGFTQENVLRYSSFKNESGEWDKKYFDLDSVDYEACKFIEDYIAEKLEEEEFESYRMDDEDLPF